MKNPILFKTLLLTLIGFGWSNLWLNTDAYCNTFESTREAETSMLLCNTPANLFTDNITETSATFDWSVVYGAVSYSVQTRLPNGTWYFVPGSPFMNTYTTVNWFDPNTTYEWRVRANCNYGETSNWSYPVSFTTQGYYSCQAPGWLETENITQTSAIWDWDPVYGAQNYSVQWRYAGGTWYNLGGGPFNGTQVNVGGLNPGTAYEWRVRSNCGYNNYSPWSYPASFTTLGAYCSVPYNLYTSNITDNSATFNWGSSQGAQSYSVQYRLPGGTWYNVYGSPFTGNWTTQTGLNSNTTYEWRIRANCSYNESSDWSYPIPFTTTGGYYCNAPSWLGANYITQTSASLDWNNVNGAYQYIVEYRVAGGTWYTAPGSPFINSWAELTGLQPGTYYEWRVKTVCNNWQTSAWSYTSAFTTQGYSCGAPVSTYTTNVTESSATFSWSAVPGAQSYSVQIRTPYGQWNYINGSPFNGTSATAYNLAPNTTYEWRVRANCAYGQYGYWTPGILFTTGGSSYCHVPQWLNTTNITATTATLDWENVSGAQNYSVQWRYPGGAWNNLGGGPFYYSNVTISGLQPGTAYEWRVRSNCGYNSFSDWSSAAYFTTLNTSCSTPSGLYTSNITESSATFSWNPVPGAQSYSVQYRTQGGAWYYLPNSPFYGTSVTANGFYANTTYEWRVRANCGYGYSSYWSSGVIFTTGGSSYCGAPQYLYTANVTQTTALLDWYSASGAQSYTVEWRQAGGTWFTLATTSNTWADLVGLQPSTTYEWRVRSNCYGGNQSNWSYSVTFTTQNGGSCNAATNLQTSNITGNAATFSWDAVPGAQSYSVQWRLPNGSWNFAPGSPFTGTSVTVTIFYPNTTYEWRVRTNCGYSQYSAWTTPVSFTTTGGSGGGSNDNCSGATELTVGTTCVSVEASTINATPSSPAPQGGCNSSNYKDIWFKFTMPSGASPVATIRTTAGTLADVVMEVYVGNSCGSLAFLNCEDNNSNGNGSNMPVITVEAAAGVTVWVRVWGLNGATGTFSICVFDSASVDYTGGNNADNAPHDGNIIDEVQAVDNGSEEILNTYTVSPNPTSDVLNIRYEQIPENIVKGVVMTDLSGKVMVKRNYDAKGTVEFRDQLNLAGWTPGIYVLQIVTTNGIISEKISVID